MRDEDWGRARSAGLDAFGLTRRAVAAGGMAAFSLALLGCEVSGATPRRRMAASDWIERQGELARALKSGQISPLRWMEEVERLAGEIEIAELMASVERQQVEQLALPPTNDPRKSTVRFIDESGEPRKLGFGCALFAFEPHNVITPHGHRHMASSHLVVEGAFRVRNFDRLRDEEGAMVIRPTRDYVAATGQLSAMTPESDNIHWFVPEGGARAMTFDVIVSGIDPGMPSYEIEAVDPLAGERLADGSIRAPKIGFEAASDKYTASV